MRIRVIDGAPKLNGPWLLDMLAPMCTKTASSVKAIGWLVGPAD